MRLRKSLLVCCLTALGPAGAADASSIVAPPAPKMSPSLVSASALGQARSSIAVVDAPAGASLRVLDAPSGPLARISASVVALGTPAAAVADEPSAAAVAPQAPAPFASVEVPTVIRGGIVGNAFPDAHSTTASVSPEPEHRLEPQVGNDGQPVAEVSPGSNSSPDAVHQDGGPAAAARMPGSAPGRASR